MAATTRKDLRYQWEEFLDAVAAEVDDRYDSAGWNDVTRSEITVEATPARIAALAFMTFVNESEDL